MGTTEPSNKTDTILKRIGWLSANDAQKQFDCLMHLFNEDSLAACFHALDGKKAVGADGVRKADSFAIRTRYCHVNVSVRSLLPELGTIGSQWGGDEVTRPSTS